MLTSSENLKCNHPDHKKRDKILKFMRASFAGEDTVKELALDPTLRFIDVPAGMLGYSGQKTPAYHMVEAGKEAEQYVDRGRYPEIVSHVVAMAAGKAWIQEPEIKGDAVRDIKDTLFADGSDFRTGVLKVLEDYVLTGGGGLFVNLNNKNEAVIHHYAAENVVNWNVGANALRLVVIENEVVSDNPFSHETMKKRYVAGIDDETGRYFQERWSQERLSDDKDAKHGWVMESQARVFPTMRQRHMTSIPFIPIGDWELRPIFKPLAGTAKTFFRAYAEYAHLMYWSAMATPFFKFEENGGFWGVDDHAAGAVTDGMEDMGDGQVDVEIKLGCTTPIMLRGGSMEWSAAPTSAINAHEKRLESLRNEMGGLGARAFNPTTNSQQTAETERLQQSGEGSLIHSAYREVAMAITRAVRLAAEWRGVKDAKDFSFEFDRSIMFNFDPNEIPVLQSLHLESYITRRHVRDALRRRGTIGVNETEDALDAEIAAERGLDDDFGGGADDELTEEELLAAGVNPSDEDESEAE